MVDKVNDFECPSSTKNQSLDNYDYKYCLHKKTLGMQNKIS